MTEPTPALLQISLDNCATEPIHLPGSIQPHGMLFAFDAAGLLAAWSGNGSAVAGDALVFGAAAASLGLPADVLDSIAAVSADMHDGAALPAACEVTIAGIDYDCIVHGYANRIIVELERRALASDVVGSFALKAHGAIDRLKRQPTIDALLAIAVLQVRQLTGFDRVMAYRFRHDDSGDVVAEACSDAMEPYLGRRYPASDIPAQARRLYLINSLRTINDVGYVPVPLLGRPGDAPLDLSHAVLRSVSPIHIEYLQNMGVQASMSISIITNDRLWGMLACHHQTPHAVPYSIRMAADVMAQVLASTVQSLEAREHAAAVVRGADEGARLYTALSEDDDALGVIWAHAAPLCEVLQADAMIVTQHGHVRIHGAIDIELAERIVAALPAPSETLVEFTDRAQWPADVVAQLGKWVGLLGMSYDAASRGWVLALRMEQIESVRWGGKPEKIITQGPLGPRLTPRGSFDEWRATVRGKAEPWTPSERTIALQLLAKITRAVAARNADLARARTELMAMLGHDLRDPLQAISMAGTLLEQGSQAGTIGRRIQWSSGRMQRLISYVMDMSRINGGIGLGIVPVRIELNALLAELVDEMMTAHPNSRYELQMEDAISADVDPDRIVQVLNNLLSNARHHGQPTQPITVALTADSEHVLIAVRNAGDAIGPDEAGKLFDPFKPRSASAATQRKGLGLGLYIANQIVQGHGGTLAYHHADGEVVFTIRLPHAPA